MLMDWAISCQKGEALPMPTKKANIAERARYIPVRFTPEERKMLRILEAGLNVCPYSDIDPSTKPNIILREKIRGISAILTGLAVANSYNEGQELLKNKDFAQYSSFFKVIFEIGRRHKIMNPDKMRTEYGKLIYLLQDSVSAHIREQLGFDIKCGIKTVYQFLKERGALGILEDSNIQTATKEIIGGDRSRYQVQEEIQRKEKIIKNMVKQYSSHKITPDELKYCLYSITDNNNFLNTNSLPIEKMVSYLTTYFSADKIEEAYDLSISSGEDGARLSHDHKTQFNYVHQSLMLWREIMDNMFMLWGLAEGDLLDVDNPYELKNTGQGWLMC
eukprot:TRINITY_DN1514_c0_g2_i3.p1 TRINITY_DN1514_c0_g2~~TRINITY_DN1514_c0_g2_i3.p1  ORF type:complete len:332 (+),score=70.31 TRINITY_DN1514_c0_g2_i3:138-1133(+)